ncbi:zinc finger protein 691-like [Uranotaenia lowii]|uniref:zinc finger protein 691-like n=1 Tax=Uranotaenia lowii TaxID=190385 RepID=UPI002479734C|nr:zinc finger protein 691-like [Uranotaenia lowii]
MEVKGDLSNLCRVCTRETSLRKSEDIYEPIGSDKTTIHCMLVAICAPVFGSSGSEEEEQQQASEKGNTKLPRIVCLMCKSKIEAAYELHQTCIESDRKLWKMVISVKQEPQEYDEVLQGIVVEPLVVLCPSASTKQEQALDLNDEEVYPGDSAGDDDFDEDDDYKDGDYIEPSSGGGGAGSDCNENSGKRKTRRKRKEKKPPPPKVDASERTCGFCFKLLRTVLAMMKHMKADHPDQVRACTECDCSFDTEEKLATHKVDHGMPCQVCNHIVQPTREARAHAPHKCDQCGKGFFTAKNLKQHMLCHTDQRPFACDLCPMSFPTKGSLKTHMVTHTREKNYICDICGSRFQANKSLLKHSRIHAGIRPYACELCDFKFTNSYALKRHMRTHTGEKPYKCCYCERAFAQSNDLVKHSRTHIGDNPYRCDRCEATFRFMADLRKHYEIHYQGTTPEEALKALDRRQGGKKKPSTEADTGFRFTTVSLLSKRFEIETKEKHDDGPTGSEQSSPVAANPTQQNSQQQQQPPQQHHPPAPGPDATVQAAAGVSAVRHILGFF